MKKIVIIPTYNEAENIEMLIMELLDKDTDILVIDDNSPDGTGKIAGLMNDNRIKVINRQKKLGIGSAHLEGFRYALENNYDYILTMDADFSHNPIHIPEMFSQMKKYDVCIGSRYSHGGEIENWNIFRKLISRTANFLTKIKSGISDNTGAYRCYRAKVIKELLKENIQSDGYSFFIETAILLKKFKVREIPITFKERKYGKSKISKKEIFNAVKILVFGKKEIKEDEQIE